MADRQTAFPPQHQEKQPAIQKEMEPQPREKRSRGAAGRLVNKKALITGADSGIGRAVAVLFASEGADISVLYFNEHEDARETEKQVKETGRDCRLHPGDIQEEDFCRQAVDGTVREFGKLDILVNNAGVQFPQDSLMDITSEQWERTFRTNIYGMFYMTRAALPYMKEGGIIINTTSVTAYQGHPTLIDYASTKGAIVAFTRSLAISLAGKGIRVNAVAPGPVWTPLVTSFPEKKLESFGESTPMGRAGQPAEIAPCYLFLATEDSSYMTGQVLHPNRGENNKRINGGKKWPSFLKHCIPNTKW